MQCFVDMSYYREGNITIRGFQAEVVVRTWGTPTLSAVPVPHPSVPLGTGTTTLSAVPVPNGTLG